ncbi:hypothetical protein OEA41_008684 [Lepraria neglecta]|uniref:Uncharacterized protein n=1 Tax=Lepraria neglecta TaxID=209136 RepID=A0AAE0DH08_9LECA|nr:hypothetical protein OEA41_008684 [Lepraria neglecta]
MVTIPQYNKPLPQCEGPKLRPFDTPKPAVTFRRLLSDKDSEGHTHVFEAAIESAAYALKMFKFCDFKEQRAGLVGKENDLVTDDLLQAHSDPFYNECRAYGRLQDKNLNGKVAVLCHGYITLPASVKEQLKRKFHISDWDRPGDEYSKPVSQRQPFRAIIKDLIQEDTPLTGKAADKILRDLKKMQRCGIYPGDIRSRNYKAGLLVDLSIARTEPYYLFNIQSARQVAKMKNGDLYI